ncbi:hypothetical protein IIA29_13100 [candidate division KSB1 bacterium]|nr:hypothetical protein [candidate division KSB1 bacterium]
MPESVKTAFLGLTLLLILLMLNPGCSSHAQYTRQSALSEEADDRSIQKPDYQEVGLYQDGLENVAGRPVKDFFNLAAHYRKLTNNHKQAKNVNALQEVPNSTWFTNRHGTKRMAKDELQRGPNRGTGSAAEGQLIITGAKVQGVSPGFTIKDSRGDVYFLKFDLKGYPDLNTAPEVITMKFVYACGYNTPENYIVNIDGERFRLGEGVTYTNKYLREVDVKFEDIQEVLNRAHRNADGSYRAVASKLLPGKPVGPFKYAGTRKDDGNDHVPHNHRREMRGYKVIAAWLNSVDTKANNTLDMYVEEGGRQFVKHYIIDFATSLGAGGNGPASSRRGTHGAADIGNMILRALTLGLWVEPFEKKLGAQIRPSVGYFDSELYDPGDFAFIIPNPAFVRATELDGFWGAKLVMSFNDEDIRAIVETGEYSNKSDAAYVTKILIERRDKTGRYWFKKINPLDNFQFAAATDSKLVVSFDDLAVKYGFAVAGQTIYRYRLRYRNKNLTGFTYARGAQKLDLNSDIERAIEEVLSISINGSGNSEAERIFSFRIETQRGRSGFGKHVEVYFYLPPPGSGTPEIVALEREN